MKAQAEQPVVPLRAESASGVREALDAAMVAAPGHWQPFYPDEPEAAAHARRYSRSDRSRYYWPVARVRSAVDAMHDNLNRTGLPGELVSQFLPWLNAAEAPGSALGHGGGLTPDAVLRAAVRRVLDIYSSVV